MLLEEELIEMTWAYPNRKKYEELGYVFTKPGDKFWAKAIDVFHCSCGVKIPVICDYCGEVYYPTARNYEKMRKHSNIDCCVSCKGKKIKNTVQNRYGVDSVALVEQFREKRRKTCQQKYGVNSPLECKNIYNKTRKSLEERYGISDIGQFRSTPEIADKIEKTNQLKYGGVSPFCSKEIRQKIRNSFYANGTCPTSKKQKELCEKIQKLYGNCVLNYPCDLVSLDCMAEIQGIKFDIEYDGWYWHKDRIEEDKRRNFFVGGQGYKIIRFLAFADRLPTDEEIVETINYLLTTNNKFIQIELT